MATAAGTNNGRAQQQSGGASLPPVQEQHMQQPVMQCPASRIPIQPPNPMMPGAAMYPFQEELMRPYVPNLPSSRILNPMMQGAAMYPFQAGLMRPYMPNMATHTIQFPTRFMSPFHSHSPAFNPQCPAINSHSPLTPAINPQPLRAFAVNHQPPLTPAVNPQPPRAPAVNPQPPPAPATNPQPQPAPAVNPQPPPTPAVNPQLPLPKKKRRRRKRNVAIDSKTKACVQVDTTQLRVPATPTGLGNTSVPLNRSLLQAVEDKMVGANQKRSCEANLEQLSELDKETVVKETRSIIEELCEDKDMKEAVECVKEMKSPGILHVFVSEAINYALENTSECRQLVGQLFHQLLQNGTLAVDRMVAGLGAVMKTAEDIEIDVPKIWDYIGELLCPPVANRTLPLGTLISTTFPSNLLASGKAALLTTKLLRQCVVVTSEEVVFQLWSSCKEQHDCLQLRPEDLEFDGMGNSDGGDGGDDGDDGDGGDGGDGGDMVMMGMSSCVLPLLKVVLQKAEQPSQRQAALQLAVVSDGGSGRKGSRQGERNKIISPNPHSEPEEIEFRKAEQPWQRQAVLLLELTEEQKETQEVFRKFRSILNRLTPQKLTELADATLQLKINTEERLRGVVDLIFTRVITETMYSGEVYANLCQVLGPFDVETVNAKGKLKTITFKRLLLSKCEQEFLKDMQEDEEREAMQKGVETAETEEIRKQRQMELEAAGMASRQRMLGNIRFIGELYKLKMLSESTIHECMIRLLKSSSNEKSLECFAKLMTITGTELDKEEAKLEMDIYFSRVNDIIKKRKISKRVQFVLQDVVDLRDNQWVPRKRQDTEVKTIDQIHREAEDEEQMTKQLASQYIGGDGGDERKGSIQVESRKIIPQNPHSALEVKLRKAEQPWQRQAVLQLELTDKQKETQEVFRKFRSILNRLTPQNVTKLADATCQLKINTEERLRGVVDMIFTRAIAETVYSEVYIDVCRILFPWGVATVVARQNCPAIVFRCVLLTKCQEEFEKDKQEDEERKTMQKGVETAETEEIRKQQHMELEAAEMASRQRMLTSIRFIGELYKLKTLSESIMHECMRRFRKSSSDEKSLECFAMLMTVTGKELDKEKTKLEIDTYFSKVNDIIKKGKLSKRVQFVLQDVVDLRDNKWVPRQRQDTEVKTIAKQPWRRNAVLQLELTEEQETREVFRKVQSILNRLTPQKLTKLAKAIQQLKINTEERLRGVVDLIFTRATTEMTNCEVYTNLCRVLASLAVETVNAEGKPQAVTFIRLLVIKCQQEFEKDMQEDEERKTMQKGVETAETEEIRKQRQTALEAAEMASRHRSLGNIRFIGELYNLKILFESTIHECMIRLLKSSSNEKSLECFAKLMTVTGTELNKEEAKLEMDTYFSTVNDIIKKGKISKRVQFALQDVVDLRDNQWVPRQRQNTKLKKAEQPWQRQAVLQLDLTEERKKTQDLFCKFRSVLNRLTPQKLTKLVDATLQLNINTEERLRGVVDMIFTRAITETMYSEVYTNFCCVLLPFCMETINAERKPETITFRRLLLTKCQQEFEKDKQEDEERETMQKGVETAETEEIRKQRQMELEAAEMASRQRMLGSIRFIGELYKLKGSHGITASCSFIRTLKTLSESIMHECMRRFRKTSSDEKSLECFAMLMTVTGKELDKEKTKLEIDTYYSTVNDIINRRTISKRVQFVLQDVVDLRDNKWVPRQRQDAKVKTIDQIHREAEDEEQLTKQLASQCTRGNGRRKHGLLHGRKVATPQSPHSVSLEDLTARLGFANVSNNEILKWIERSCTPEECRSPTFITTLTTAMVQGAVTGKGSNAHLARDLFETRLEILTEYVNSDEKLELEVLLALEMAVAKLDHPPKLLYQMFNAVYDCEVVGENSCYTWRDRAQEGVEGKGTAVMSVKAFFDWLESAARESDHPEGTSGKRQA
ncbi:hypothetical protein EMCRGX_G016035 [Ephydatia muelleri]